MAILSSRVTVAVTATVLVPKRTSISETAHVVVKNTGGATVYIGGAGVTTSNGYLFANGDSITLDMDTNDALYGIIGSSTNVVSVLVVS